MPCLSGVVSVKVRSCHGRDSYHGRAHRLGNRPCAACCNYQLWTVDQRIANEQFYGRLQRVWQLPFGGLVDLGRQPQPDRWLVGHGWRYGRGHEHGRQWPEHAQPDEPECRAVDQFRSVPPVEPPPRTVCRIRLAGLAELHERVGQRLAVARGTVEHASQYAGATATAKQAGAGRWRDPAPHAFGIGFRQGRGQRDHARRRLGETFRGNARA